MSTTEIKQEKCKKHNKPIIEPEVLDFYYDYESIHNAKCEVCKRVEQKEYQKRLSKCNWVVDVNKDLGDSLIKTQVINAIKYKPRHKLKKGDYAVLDYKTGYLVKANSSFVQFYVVG